MAFNRKTFQTRALTAIVFVLVMLAGLLINHWTFFILFSIIHFGCWIEYQKLVGLIDKNYLDITPFHKYGVMIAGFCVLLYFTNDDLQLFGVRLQELGWWAGLLFMFVLPIMEVLFTRNIRLRNIGHSIFGLLYISLSCGLMMDLYENIGSPVYGKAFVSMEYFIPAVIIASIWINDTMAYIVGSFIGKHPLSKISPRKTWEGTIGGILLCIAVVSFLSCNLIGQEFFIIHLTAIAFIAAIAGTFGDLLESKLKRLAGVKDSGHIMPGHGGFLDRFDSMLLAIPFVWIYVRLFVSAGDS